VRGKDTYSGGFIERANRMLYPAWGRLTDALRSGKPQVDAYAAVTTDPVRRNQFLAMMDSVNGLLVPDILTAFDWTTVDSVADVGGARGNLAGRVAQANPHLRGTVFDLPEITAAANAHLETLGVSDRVTFTAGDFFTDELPRADVIIYGHVLHNWSPAERAGLVKKAYEALPPGGTLLIYDAMLDDDRSDLSQLLVSLNMLLVTEGGSEYTVQECTGYLTEAGFTGIAGTRVGNNNTLVIGHRPA
jgi:SAM-dependent methyltransferase